MPKRSEFADSDADRQCEECKAIIRIGEPMYRYMIAKHINVGAYYNSRGRVFDHYVCSDCHIAAMRAMATRPRRTQ